MDVDAVVAAVALLAAARVVGVVAETLDMLAVTSLPRLQLQLALRLLLLLLQQVVAMHRQEAESSLFRGLLAVAEGSVSPGRTLPVTGLVLRGLVGLTDRVLAEALQTLKGLRWGCVYTDGIPGLAANSTQQVKH